MTRLTEHFTKEEFDCKCGCGNGDIVISEKLVFELECVRAIILDARSEFRAHWRVVALYVSIRGLIRVRVCDGLCSGGYRAQRGFLDPLPDSPYWSASFCDPRRGHKNLDHHCGSYSSWTVLVRLRFWGN